MCFLQLFQTQAAQVQAEFVSLTLKLKYNAGGLEPKFECCYLIQSWEVPSSLSAIDLMFLLQVSNTMPIISADLFLPLFAFSAVWGGRWGMQRLEPRLPAVINTNIQLNVHKVLSSFLSE